MQTNNTASIEDIVPFPEKENSTREIDHAVTASGSTSSTDSFVDTIHEQSCPSGTCNYQQRRKCAGLLRSVFVKITIAKQFHCFVDVTMITLICRKIKLEIKCYLITESDY